MIKNQAGNSPQQRALMGQSIGSLQPREHEYYKKHKWAGVKNANESDIRIRYKSPNK